MKFALFESTETNAMSSCTAGLQALLASYGDEVTRDVSADVDMVISMGGDGTFLRAAERVGSLGIPIVGINTGHLGFLADVQTDEIEAFLSSVHRGDYSVRSRSVLRVEVLPPVGNGELKIDTGDLAAPEYGVGLRPQNLKEVNREISGAPHLREAEISKKIFPEILSEATPNSWRMTLPHGNSQFSTLNSQLNETSQLSFALNEVAVTKHDSASMIGIHTYVNGEALTTYHGDGLLVATPTGSTAYSLSAGGPIIHPQSSVMLLTAVAPHSLNMRPIIISDDSTVELVVDSRSGRFLIAIDGTSRSVEAGTRILLSKAPYRINVVKQTGSTWFSTLRQKMMWGAHDPRR